MRDINGEDRKTGRKLKKGQEKIHEQTALQKQAFVLLWTVSTTGRNALSSGRWQELEKLNSLTSDKKWSVCLEGVN